MKHIVKVIETTEKFYLVDIKSQQELNDKVLEILKGKTDCDGFEVISPDFSEDRSSYEIYGHYKDYNPYTIVADYTERPIEEVMGDNLRETKEVKDE